MKNKIKNDVKLNELQKYGYKYTGNYNRGEVWEKEIDIIIENKNLGGILIDDFREISFKFPYVKHNNHLRKISMKNIIKINKTKLKM